MEYTIHSNKALEDKLRPILKNFAEEVLNIYKADAPVFNKGLDRVILADETIIKLVEMFKFTEMYKALIWFEEWNGTRKPDGERPNRSDVARLVRRILAEIDKGENE